MNFPTEAASGTGPFGLLGHVTSVQGSDVSLEFPLGAAAQRNRATVGRFVGIGTDRNTVIGTITRLEAQLPMAGKGMTVRASIDLVGEILADAAGTRRFRRGITEYPAIGDDVELVGREALALIHDNGARDLIEIGHLHQDPTVSARIDVNDLLSKHFAVLGTTGVGKSSGVAVILRGILEARPDLRVFLLDGHNEYGRCFESRAHVISARNLKLPFWLFSFDEMLDVIYGGRPAVAEEADILAELIPLAKSTYGQHKVATERGALRRNDVKATGFTVETPVPYMLQDLLGLIDDRMGRLDNRSARMHYHHLLTRLETLRNDPRYGFMFQNANVGGDTMGEILTQLFRFEPDGKPMCVMQLGGLPAEVVDAVVSVLARMAFDFGLWSEGAAPLLFMCEEAHRFASADHTIGFHPTRRALSRIAKEGRKHGVFLGLVTQRPAELDPTIISQCSTLFAMRMSNERDQALLRSAVSDATANLLSFVPSLGTREVIGFGEGVPLAARMTFKELPAHLLPRNEASDRVPDPAVFTNERDYVKEVLDRWRGATMSGRPRAEDAATEPAPSVRGPLPIHASVEQVRQRLLKRPIEDPERLMARDGTHRQPR